MIHDPKSIRYRYRVRKVRIPGICRLANEWTIQRGRNANGCYSLCQGSGNYSVKSRDHHIDEMWVMGRETIPHLVIIQDAPHPGDGLELHTEVVPCLRVQLHHTVVQVAARYG